MLPEMTDEQRKAYFENGWDEKDPNFMSDILAGKIHIWDVPFEYRFRKTYIYACRSARISSAAKVYFPDDVVARHLAEQKIIENMLLSDIIECDKRNMSERKESLCKTYFDYFSRGGINCTGLI